MYGNVTNSRKTGMTAETVSTFGTHMQWEPRRRMTLAAARRRSILVKWLRAGFSLSALSIIGVVMVYILISANQPAPVLPPPPVQVVVEDEVRMIQPRFTGHDDTGRPYVVVADSAVNRGESESEGVTDLVAPKLDTDPTRDDNATVSADRGVYDATNKVLDLYDKVQLGTNSGYVYETDHARFLIGEDRIVGDEAVSGVGPMGSIEADSYEIIKGGERVVFRGRVRTRIQATKKPDGE
ncbi:MAG: hypothetical protein COA47_04585 [Robiginitomaculum sp.]|nr:MAG: hypothetical protein COA47_04585 [Robiginitomaculum sp.]